MTLLSLLTLPARIATDIMLGPPERTATLGMVTAGARPPAPKGWRWRSDGLLERA